MILCLSDSLSVCLHLRAHHCTPACTLTKMHACTHSNVHTNAHTQTHISLILILMFLDVQLIISFWKVVYVLPSSPYERQPTSSSASSSVGSTTLLSLVRFQPSSFYCCMGASSHDRILVTLELGSTDASRMYCLEDLNDGIFRWSTLAAWFSMVRFNCDAWMCNSSSCM